MDNVLNGRVIVVVFIVAQSAYYGFGDFSTYNTRSVSLPILHPLEIISLQKRRNA